MPDFDDLYASAGFEDNLLRAWSDTRDRKERHKSQREVAKMTRELLDAYEAEGFTHTEATEWAMFIIGLSAQMSDDEDAENDAE